MVFKNFKLDWQFVWKSEIITVPYLNLCQTTDYLLTQQYYQKFHSFTSLTGQNFSGSRAWVQGRITQRKECDHTHTYSHSFTLHLPNLDMLFLDRVWKPGYPNETRWKVQKDTNLNPGLNIELCNRCVTLNIELWICALAIPRMRPCCLSSKSPIFNSMPFSHLHEHLLIFVIFQNLN